MPLMMMRSLIRPVMNSSPDRVEKAEIAGAQPVRAVIVANDLRAQAGPRRVRIVPVGARDVGSVHPDFADLVGRQARAAVRIDDGDPLIDKRVPAADQRLDVVGSHRCVDLVGLQRGAADHARDVTRAAGVRLRSAKSLPPCHTPGMQHAD